MLCNRAPHGPRIHGSPATSAETRSEPGTVGTQELTGFVQSKRPGRFFGENADLRQRAQHADTASLRGRPFWPRASRPVAGRREGDRRCAVSPPPRPASTDVAADHALNPLASARRQWRCVHLRSGRVPRLDAAACCDREEEQQTDSEKGGNLTGTPKDGRDVIGYGLEDLPAGSSLRHYSRSGHRPFSIATASSQRDCCITGVR